MRMSVRGTMTERTRVSPKSKTDWISSASLSSITSDSVARSTSSRNSSSLKNASLSAGAPGATALPRRDQPARDGPEHPRRANRISGALKRTRAAEWTRPSCRGETPTITKPTSAMMPVATSPASQTLSSRLCSSTVTATAEAISNQIRQNRRARMWAMGWARMRFSAVPRLCRIACSASCRGR